MDTYIYIHICVYMYFYVYICIYIYIPKSSAVFRVALIYSIRVVCYVVDKACIAHNVYVVCNVYVVHNVSMPYDLHRVHKCIFFCTH